MNPSDDAPTASAIGINDRNETGLLARPVGEVLGPLGIPDLPEGSTARGVLALVKVDDADDDIGWCVRVTSDLDDEEVLGVLVGYVEHLKQEAATSWDDLDVTRAQT